MKCDKIAERAERLTDTIGEIVNEIDFIADVLNEFQEDIADSIPLVTTTTIIVSSNEATDGTWKDLPTNLISLYAEKGQYSITKNDVDYTGNVEVRSYGKISQIRFNEEGTFVVLYKKTPTEIVSSALATTEPDMHPHLHSLGAIFLASKYKFRDNMNDNQDDELMNEYNYKKQQKIKTLLNPTDVTQTIIDVYSIT